MLFGHGLPIDFDEIERSILGAVGSIFTELASRNNAFSGPESSQAPSLLPNLTRLHSEQSLGLLTHWLLSIATALRAADDRADRKLLKAPLLGAEFSDSVGPPTLREACNKIIHATGSSFFDVEALRPDGEHLSGLSAIFAGPRRSPLVRLFGEKGQTKWNAQIDLIAFLDAAAFASAYGKAVARNERDSLVRALMTWPPQGSASTDEQSS